MLYKKPGIWRFLFSTKTYSFLFKTYSFLLIILTSSLTYFVFGEPALSNAFKNVLIVDEKYVVSKPVFSILALIGLTLLFITFVCMKKVLSFEARKATNDKEQVDNLVKAFYRMAKTIEDRDSLLEVECEKALNANRAKTDFLLNISHELRTPMHAIMNFAEIGQNKAVATSTDKIQLYFSRIEESGERLLGIINSMLDLTVLEAGKVDMEFEDNNLEECAKESVDGLMSLIDKKNLMVKIDNKSKIKDWTVDRPHIIQVFVNLLSNAIKFSPEGKNITILLEKRDDEVHISIIDEGIGIPDDEINVIFDKFIRSSTTGPNVGGSGIGLAICREIVGLHGGRITAKNNENGGATFTFVIPKITEEKISKKTGE